MTGAQKLARAALVLWMCGTILFEKDFAYWHLGPLYVTEAVLLLLVAVNFGAVRASDLVFFCLLATYVVGGLVKNGNPFFVCKDMSWLYYLLFLRVLPTTLTRRQVALVFAATVVSLAWLAWKLAFQPERQTREILALFLVTLLFVGRRRVLGWAAYVFWFGIAIASEFKGEITLAALFPLALAYKGRMKSLLTKRMLLPAAGVIVLLVATNVIQDLLYWIVDQINAGAGLLGLSHRFAQGTSYWRASIWHQSFRHLLANGTLLFGELPGQNLMDSRLLLLPRDIVLPGGEQLGVLRSAHNLVVQILTKGGLVGLFAYVYFFTSWVRRFAWEPHTALFAVLTLVLSIGHDIPQVPFRGPLFYSFLAVLCSSAARYGRDERTQPAVELAEPAVLRGTRRRDVPGGLAPSEA